MNNTAKRIVFYANGFNELGFGHIYRTIILSRELIARGHDVVVLSHDVHKTGIEKMRNEGLSVTGISGGHESIIEWLVEQDRHGCRTDIFVHDFLNTSAQFIQFAKQVANGVVSIEDLGEGRQHTDATINAIYELDDDDNIPSNEYYGAPYMCLRSEVISTGTALVRQDVHHITVSFGGSDPLDMSSRLYDIATSSSHFDSDDIKWTFVLGPGYEGKLLDVWHMNAQERMVEKIANHNNAIEVFRDINNLHEIMKASDIVLCSQGTSVYELCCIGVPTIVISQNERELTHGFACPEHGFVTLGLGSNIGNDEIEKQILELITSLERRQTMQNLMLAQDLSSGTERVISLILGIDD